MNYEKLLSPDPVRIEIVESHNIAPGSTVVLDGVIFENNIVSKIEFVEFSYPDAVKTLAIKLYTGNLINAVVVTNEDYVIEVEEGERPSYFITKASNFNI